MNKKILTFIACPFSSTDDDNDNANDDDTYNDADDNRDDYKQIFIIEPFPPSYCTCGNKYKLKFLLISNEQ